MERQKGKGCFTGIAIFIGIVALIGIAGKSGKNSDNSNTSVADKKIESSSIAEATSSGNTEDSVSASQNETVTLKYGELLSINSNLGENGGVVIKAKITSSLTNEMTINQNYYNIEDLVQNQGFDKYSEIQYWAVADMADGSESKVISFTVDKNLIEKLKSGNFATNTMGDYVSDLWVLPSLQSN